MQEVLKSKLANGYTDINVFAHTSSDKLQKFFENNYLSLIYDNLQKLENILIIYGCSMGLNDTCDNDSHVWRQVVNAKNLEAIIIGLPTENYYKNKILINKKFQSYCYKDKQAQILFFKQEEYNIWKDSKWIENVLEHAEA